MQQMQVDIETLVHLWVPDTLSDSKVSSIESFYIEISRIFWLKRRKDFDKGLYNENRFSKNDLNKKV
jgi:hypothetical protein